MTTFSNISILEEIWLFLYKGVCDPDDAIKSTSFSLFVFTVRTLYFNMLNMQSAFVFNHIRSDVILLTAVSSCVHAHVCECVVNTVGSVFKSTVKLKVVKLYKALTSVPLTLHVLFLTEEDARAKRAFFPQRAKSSRRALLSKVLKTHRDQNMR